MLAIGHDPANDLITIRAGKTLTEMDYERALPALEEAIDEGDGPLNAVVILDDLQGWTLPGLWQELRFDVAHYDDFARIAVIGDSLIEEWGAKASTVATGAEIEFFSTANLDRARAWAMAG